MRSIDWNITAFHFLWHIACHMIMSKNYPFINSIHELWDTSTIRHSLYLIPFVWACQWWSYNSFKGPMKTEPAGWPGSIQTPKACPIEHVHSVLPYFLAVYYPQPSWIKGYCGQCDMYVCIPVHLPVCISICPPLVNDTIPLPATIFAWYLEQPYPDYGPHWLWPD